MQRASFPFHLFLVVLAFIHLGCSAEIISVSKSHEGIKPENDTQIQQAIGIIHQAFDILIKEHYPPISPHAVLVGAVKGIEKSIGPTNLLSHDGGMPRVVSPSRKRPFNTDINSEDAQNGLLEIFQYVVDRNTEAAPIFIAQSAIQGMVDSPDSHSSYLSPQEYNELYVDTKRKFFGVGIEITMQVKGLTVVSPIQGTSAYKAGIKTGDHIVRIEGKETKGMKLMEAVKRMRGERGTSLTLTIMREGFSKPRDFSIERVAMPSQSVHFYTTAPGYGHVRITHFTDSTFIEMQKALLEVFSGKAPLNSLVLDLRDNPGGLLDQAVKIADIFLVKGLILSIKDRSKTHPEFLAHRDSVKHAYPIIVVINKGSAGASEILAGALQDHGRALILGIPSFGKGIIQAVSALKDGSALRYTTGQYATPNGRVFHEVGIMPDILVGTSSIIANLREDSFTMWKSVSGKRSLSAVPAIFTDYFDKDPVLAIAHEILKQCRSNQVSDMLALAKKINTVGPRISAAGDLNGKARKLDSKPSVSTSQSEATSQDKASIHGYLGRAVPDSQKPSLEIHRVGTRPEKVPAGGKFDLLLDYTITDSSVRQDLIQIMFSYCILGDKEILLNSEPAVIEAANGNREGVIVHLIATKKKGIYTIKTFLRYENHTAEKTVDLQIE